MNRWMDLRTALLALAMFALGFMVADRMSPASAGAPAGAQEGAGGGFSGTDGAVTVGKGLFVIRGDKYYFLDPSDKGAQRPWGQLQ
jgi:hypothetical protein